MVSDDSTSRVMAGRTLAPRHRKEGKRTGKGELTLASKGLDEDLHVVVDGFKLWICRRSVGGDGWQRGWRSERRCVSGFMGGEAKQEIARNCRLVSHM